MNNIKYNIITAEKHAIAMMKQGRNCPTAIRDAAKAFKINEYDLSKKMGISLDLFSFIK